MANKANDISNDANDIKRIVLVGYPGSGKTMLAIGLYKNSLRKGASITIDDTDPRALQSLAELATDIENKKIFPAANQLVVGDGEHSDRKAYPFVFNWRGKTFRVKFEDYAGEWTSNPDLAKEFAYRIIGTDVCGAILLLNPGMELFKAAEDIPQEHREKALVLRESMPKVYTAIIQKLCEDDCKNIVLAITASDRISKGGDLLRDGKGLKQFQNFNETLKEIQGFLKNAKTKNGHRVDYTVVNVTVTGQLEYDQNGVAKEVHLARSGENTAADPFLWIIDPWRMRFRKLAKRLMWIVPSSLLFFLAMYAGAHVWNGYKIENCLDQADSALSNFGNPEAANFDNEKGPNSVVVAEACLKNVNEREWFVADKDKQTIDKRLPTLLAKLMTNQVWLAYKNTKVDKSNYNDPHMALEGQTEFESWPYWARSTRGKASYEAVRGFRDQMTMKLFTIVLESNVKYLIENFRSVDNYGKEKDEDIKSLFEHTHNCSNDMVVAGNTNDLDNLISLRDICLKKWEKDVSDGISKNETDDAEIRVSCVITKDTGLDKSKVWKRIVNAHRDVELRGFIRGANQCEKEVLDGNNGLQNVANELFRYLSENAESPYKGRVLNAARERFNEAVSTMLSSEYNRKDLFDQIFNATRKLKKLDGKVFNEECFGDNALYWLAATITNENGIVYQNSTDWLRYDFQCEIAVRTDHAKNNPGAPDFKREVDANMTLSWGNIKKKIGGNWLIKNDSGEAEWTIIPDSKVSATMAATDTLRIDVAPGEEDWKVDVDIPPFFCNFSPGWNDVEQYLAYKSKTDVYPREALYRIKLHKVQIANRPYDAFSKALKMAKERKAELNAKRGKEEKDADAELEHCVKDKGVRK